MKKIFTLCIIALAAFFCYNKCADKFEANILKCKREEFVADSIARREAFIADSLEHLDAVKSIKGLGQLHIGNTYTQVKHNFDKHSDYSYYNPNYHTGFRCGNWENKIPRSIDFDREDAISQYIHKNITNIKECTTFHYKIGDIEIGRVSCAFYKNKLVAISFNGSDEILDHYIKKYGNGCEYFPDGDADWALRYAERTWANENVTLKYDGFGDCVLIISNDGGFDKYLEELKTYEEKYKYEMETKHLSDLNQL